LRSSKAKKLWRKLFRFEIGDHVKLLENLKTLPFHEKGTVGRVERKDKERRDVYLIKIREYYIWLSSRLFEFTEESLE